MAIITRFYPDTRSFRRAAKTAECAYQVVEGDDGEAYLQLVTFGSDDRQDIGSPSQNIRLSERMARQLVEILREAFPHVDENVRSGDRG